MAPKQKQLPLKHAPYKRGKVPTVSAEPLRSLRAEISASPKQMADTLGVSDSSIHKWEKTNRMPKTVGLAVEGLRRRRGGNGGYKMLLVRVSSAMEREMVERIATDVIDLDALVSMSKEK